MSTKLPHGLCSRRHFLEAGGFGLGLLGLATLLRQDGLLAAPFPADADLPEPSPNRD